VTLMSTRDVNQTMQVASYVEVMLDKDDKLVSEVKFMNIGLPAVPPAKP